jgi:hypothetical protein
MRADRQRLSDIDPTHGHQDDIGARGFLHGASLD